MDFRHTGDTKCCDDVIFQASNYDRLQRPIEKNQAHEPIFFFADLDSAYSKVLLYQIW